MALSHAILIALSENPSSGYDLAKRFDGAVSYLWDATHQQIYRELAKLEAAGHVAVEILEQDDRPTKKLYSITPAGQEFLMAWFTTPSPSSSVKDNLVLKLYGGYAVAPEVLLAELRHHRKQHQTRLVEYQALEDKRFPDTANLTPQETYHYLTLRHGIQYEQNWLKWCDEAIATLQALLENPSQN
jgi:DNA-binding PadR family transcriptional regulator